MEGRGLSSAGVRHDDRVDILGVGVSPIVVDDAIATIERWISERSRNYVCIAGVHGVMESRRNQRLRRIHNDAGMVTPTACPWFGSYASSANGTWIACMVPI
jgi:N-acetylglucosaminyldiphosphoundecaprenol N-acetyl-beta-D-mannosaminyltransferase